LYFIYDELLPEKGGGLCLMMMSVSVPDTFKLPWSQSYFPNLSVMPLCSWVCLYQVPLKLPRSQLCSRVITN